MVSRIGIRREDKNQWERRVPLSPTDIAALQRDHGIAFSLQPYPNRAFKDHEYVEVGAKIDEALDGCSIVLGIKEMPIPFFSKGKGLTYVFFSHTIKGQHYNMPMLRHIMDLGCNLIDYERITDDYGRRLVFFGVEAGQAGMINTLWTLGRRLDFEGIKNPFSGIHQALEYALLSDAEDAVREAGRKISESGVPDAIHPLVCGFAGYGNVSQGAQRILEDLPLREITPDELLHPSADTFASTRHVYKVVFKEQDMVEPVEPARGFNLREYYDYPERYRGTFGRYVPFLTVLVNAIYWTEDYPRLVTKEQIRGLFSRNGTPKLKVIGDISCDIEGAIEITSKVTDSGNPVFVADISGEARDGVEGRGPVILAVDNLPCELPRESSQRFSKALSPLIPDLANADFSAEFENIDLPPVWRRAVICHHGLLTPDFDYLKDYL